MRKVSETSFESLEDEHLRRGGRLAEHARFGAWA
jgi:hypothetical protein